MLFTEMIAVIIYDHETTNTWPCRMDNATTIIVFIVMLSRTHASRPVPVSI